MYEIIDISIILKLTMIFVLVFCCLIITVESTGLSYIKSIIKQTLLDYIS